jgi:hypothetical protein
MPRKAISRRGRRRLRSGLLEVFAFQDLRGQTLDCGRMQVADGTRTRDHRDHNPELYQLSYRHRALDRIALAGPGPRDAALRTTAARATAGARPWTRPDQPRLREPQRGQTRDGP